MKARTTILATTVAIALASCAEAEKKPEVTIPEVYSPNVTATDVRQSPDGSAEVDPASGYFHYIEIDPLLTKLVESGCEIDNIVLREVKRGGHVEVKCRYRDDLSLDDDL